MGRSLVSADLTAGRASATGGCLRFAPCEGKAFFGGGLVFLFGLTTGDEDDASAQDHDQTGHIEDRRTDPAGGRGERNTREFCRGGYYPPAET